MNELKQFILGQVDEGRLARERAFSLLREIVESELRPAPPPAASPAPAPTPAPADDAAAAPIAVVGLSCRLPGASSVDRFWANLTAGVDAVGPFPRARLDDVIRVKRELWDRYHDAVEGAPPLLGGWLEDVDRFDPAAFGIHGPDAVTMGPAERLFLTVGWEALESAGCTRAALEGARLGMYLAHSPEIPFEYARLLPADDTQAVAFNNPGATAYRLAYWLNTRGPTMVVNTTCSSSLVATHLACQALRAGDCDTALAGGLNFYLFPLFHDTSDSMQLLAPDGRCKAFDAAADGLSMGEGVALFVLKRLDRARADGDFVYAVIRGSAVSSDGRSNGVTAPNPEAQTDAILRAWQQAGIDPRRIGCVEAHGTGTRLGDPIEIKGLTDAFRRFTDATRFCALGSVKTNLSHLGDAAGAASLLKLVLSLHHKTLPRSLHFSRENPLIPFEGSPFEVNAALRAWPAGDGPRLGAVSSFGISGTNCHMVVEEHVPATAPAARATAPANANATRPERCALAVSAPHLGTLWQLLARYQAFLEEAPRGALAELCYSALARQPAEYRVVVIADGFDDLRQKLARLAELRHLERLPPRFAAQGILAARVSATAKERYAELPADDGSRAVAVARAYLTEEVVPADRFYPEGMRRKVPLPPTPFLETRCWPPHEVAREEHFDDLFFAPRWSPRPLQPGRAAPRAGRWLLLGDEGDFCRGLREELRAHGATTVLVRAGERFADGPDGFVIDPAAGAHFEQVARAVAEHGGGPLAGIIHAWTCRSLAGDMASFEGLTESQDLASLSVFRLFRALARHGLGQDADFVVATAYAHGVDGSEAALSPARVTTCGVVRVISQEHPLVGSLAVDVDLAGTGPAEAARQVVAEIALERHRRDELVAYRGGRRYVQALARLLPAGARPPRHVPRAGGVYVLAGGTGALGIQLGIHLARQQKVKIVLLSRTPLPPRERWGSDDTRSPALASAVAGIREMEALGAEVLHLPADVTDPVQVDAAFRRVRERFGRVDGLVVAMKQLAHKPLLDIPEEEFVAGIMNRVQGTWLLERATAGDDLDFFVLLSSISSLMGTKTAAECCAVNQYLDQYPAYLAPSGRRVMALNLTLVLDDLRDFRGPTPIPPLSYREFLGCFDELLARRPALAVAAKFDRDEVAQLLPVLKLRFSDEVLAWLGVTPEGALSRAGALRPDIAPALAVAVPEAAASAPAAPVAPAASAAPAAEIEAGVRGLWREIIGYDGSSADESFFAVGGTSLTALRLVKAARERWGVRFEASDLYASPTINTMIARVREQLGVAAPIATAPAVVAPAVTAPATAADDDALRRMLAGVAEGTLDVEAAARALGRK